MSDWPQSLSGFIPHLESFLRYFWFLWQWSKSHLIIGHRNLLNREKRPYSENKLQRKEFYFHIFFHTYSSQTYLGDDQEETMKGSNNIPFEAEVWTNLHIHVNLHVHMYLFLYVYYLYMYMYIIYECEYMYVNNYVILHIDYICKCVCIFT